jgi:O-succinylbenzoate synthase
MSLAELVATNAIILLAVWVCERNLKFQSAKLVQYDRIELIKPECRQQLIEDLEQRLGVKIVKVEVGAVDMLRDMTVIKVFYDSDEDLHNSVDQIAKLPKM